MKAMIPKLPGLGPLDIGDLSDFHLKFHGGMTSDNLLRSLPQRLLQSALTPQPQVTQPPQSSSPQQPQSTNKTKS